MILRHLIRIPSSLWISVSALLRDANAARSLKPIVEERHDGIVYRGLHRRRIAEMERLYVALSGAKKLAWHRRFIYWLVGDRMVIVAIERNGGEERIIGFDMFYFNKKDLEDGTIHEGFIGVISDLQNRRIGRNLRQHAINNFSCGRVRGLSSRIDMNNRASLNVALKTGFEIVEKYQDEASGKDRYYLVHRFARDRSLEH